MRILIHKEIDDDIARCKKKNLYNSLGAELPGLYRLLNKLKKLPGEYPVKDLNEEWNGKVLHAKVALPKENCGGRNGGRIVYVLIEDKCQILYVGGHKDKRYDNPYKLSELILDRLQATSYLEWVDN